MSQPEQKYGDFGALVASYEQARREFPKEVLKYFWSRLPGQAILRVLDVGCGTGISTRQLAQKKNAIIIGCDKDKAMIVSADKQRPKNVAYIVTPADNLPLPAESFDGVTAYSSFHWFATQKSIKSIQHVLKKNGIFFVANKNDAGSLRLEYRQIIGEVLERPLPDAKKDFDPQKLLKQAGFDRIEKRIFTSVEKMTLPQALVYVQSSSIWNEVPDTKRPRALELLEGRFQQFLVNGFVERTLNIVTVSGVKI